MAVREKITYKTFKDEQVENFLNGRNINQKHIVCIEGSSYSNIVNLVIDDPEKNKKFIKSEEYKPFVYVKDLKKLGIPFYKNRKEEQRENMTKYGITFKQLKTTDNNGAIVDRLEQGYKYIFYTDSAYGMRDLRTFFSKGGLDMYWKSTESFTSNLFTPEIKEGKPFIFDPNNDSILYNTISENYEIIIRDINKVVYNSIQLKYSGEFKEEEPQEDDNDDVSDLIEEQPKVSTELNGVLKKLKLFHNYEIFHDESENVYRIIFKDKLIAGEKINIFYQISNRNFFYTLKPEEQYLIQKGVRMFNGYKTYDDVHKFVFDIETTGLYPEKDRIFAIGSKDNRNFVSIDFVNEMNNDEEEKKLIINLFKHIDKLKPAIIFGYNSEDFDFNFILKRAEKLGLDIDTLVTTYLKDKTIKRLEDSSLKVGNETKYYTKTSMYGYNVLDIIHAVWKTQAINSNMKEAGLKYVCKFAGIAKPNRMYVKNGAKIYQMWKEDKLYINKSESNDYDLIPDEYQDKAIQYLEMNPDYDKIISGGEIIEQYLADDLWETLEVDKRYNESTFMLSKLLPTSLERTATIGGAGSWNLIMTAWSYENGLAIPYTPNKIEFTGGLSRTFKVGYFENIYKEDYAGLYPSIQLEHYVFPRHDVTNILFRLLSYFKFTRDKYKKWAKDETLPEEERKFYDALQLPIKILNNSNFGAFGSEYFNWADFDCAERITCTGRQYLRRMIHYFMQFGAIPITEDTDGCNFSVPEYTNVDLDFQYHQTPIKIDDLIYEYEGVTYKGVDAMVEKFNNDIIAGQYMKLDNDGMWISAANFSRKNYANLEYSTLEDKNIKKILNIPKEYLGKENEYLKEYTEKKSYMGETIKNLKIKKSKPKVTGNTIKSKTMSEYIEDFINEGINLILTNKPKEFIEFYYEYLTKIYCKQIPIKKIASKSRLKQTVEDYQKRGTDVNGKAKAKQAHMELIIAHGINTSGVDFIYYVNNGTAKSHGDVSINKKTGIYNSYVITEKELKDNPDMIGEYNVARYVSNFNKRVTALLTVFPEKVRNTLIKEKPMDREHYTDNEIQLVNFDRDSIEDFFYLEEKEVKFWNRTGLKPDDIFTEFKTDYEIKSYEYHDKFSEIKEKMKTLGITSKLKMQHQRYKNDDIVLILKKGYQIDNELIDIEYSKYLSASNVYLPLKGYKDLHTIYKKTNSKKVTEVNKFFISKVVKGELDIIKEV
jgi:DNA polymerase elongation subunit (family B)